MKLFPIMQRYGTSTIGSPVSRVKAYNKTKPNNSSSPALFKSSCSGGKLIECILIGATLLNPEPVSVGLAFDKFRPQPSDF